MRMNLAKYFSRFACFIGARGQLRPKNLGRRLALETLEDRVVPSIYFGDAGSRHVAYSGGNVVYNADIDLVFWGSGWNSGSGPALRTQLTNAVGTLMSSHYFDKLFQYGGISHGGLLSPQQTVTSSNPPNPFSDAQVDQFLQANITAHTLADFRTDSNIIYIVIPQPGSVNIDANLSGSHYSDRLGFMGPRFHYGWTINRINENPDFLTSVISHQIVEAATDPEFNFPGGRAFWVPVTNDEISDGDAERYFYRLNGVLVQSYLSENFHAYVISDGQTQNFFVNSSGVLTVNGDQLPNHDDNITIDTSGGGVRVTLNGETVQFEPGQISGIIVNTDNGNDIVNVEATSVPVTVYLGTGTDTGTDTVNISPGAHNLDNIQGGVSVFGLGSDSLNIFDQGKPFWNYQGIYSVSASSVARSGAAAISYTRLAQMNIYTGAAAPPLLAPVLINVTGTGPGTATNITADTGPSPSIFTVGDSTHSLSAIQGRLSLGGTSLCQISVNDQAATTGLSYSVNGNSFDRSGSAGITFPGINPQYGISLSGGSGTNSFSVVNTPAVGLLLNTGTGTDTVNVLTTTGRGLAINVQGGGGHDTVTLGGNTLAGISGTVTVSNGGGLAHLILNDSGDTANRSVMITSGGITGLAPADINFTSSSVNTLAVNGGAASTYMVAATPASTSTTLNIAIDTINVQGTSSPLTIVAHGGNGANVVNLGLNNSLSAIHGAVTLDDVNYREHLNVNDSADTVAHFAVLITTGGITGLAPAAINVNRWPNTLVINGGAGRTYYTFAATPAVTGVTLNLGPAFNSVLVQSTSALVTINSGGSGVDHILLGDSTNKLDFITTDVHVNAAATDTLVLYDEGTSQARTYAVYPTSVVWGANAVLFSGLASVTVNGNAGGIFDLSAGTSTSAAMILNGGGGRDGLIGSNARNSWEITGADSGILGGSAYPNPVRFSNVSSLGAGTGGDYFLFDDSASLSGWLIGRGAATLDYTPYTSSVIVDLQTGAATGVGGTVSGIANVIGASGTPASSGVYNLLIGNGGNTLTGGTGRRNILVAGGSASTLNAGDGEDLLIGGTTNYDTEAGLISWLQIANYWAGTDDYFHRVGNLTTGSGVPLLDASTVTANGGGNTMNGNGALALIYSDGMDNIIGFDPNSIIVPINP